MMVLCTHASLDAHVQGHAACRRQYAVRASCCTAHMCVVLRAGVVQLQQTPRLPYGAACTLAWCRIQIRTQRAKTQQRFSQAGQRS